MPEAIKSTAAAFAVHKMTILFFVLFSLNALGTAIIAALTGVEWATLTGQTKFLIIVAIGVNWTGLLMAFFRSAIAKIARGENPVISEASPAQP